jgi:hypothetical protein
VQFQNLGDVRVAFQKMAGINPQNFGWLSDLPANSLDEQARAWISSKETGPSSTIARCNPFAVEQQLSDIAGLYDRARVLRMEVYSVEAALIREVLSDDFEAQSEPERMSLDEMAHRANLLVAGSPTVEPPLVLNPVVPLYEKSRLLREQKRLFRREAGHPFNLLERLTLLRADYCKTISRLLAKSQAVVFVIGGSFNLLTSSPLKEYPEVGSPLPMIEEWLRSLSILFEEHANNEQIVTVYRLLGAERWWKNTNLNLADVLRAGYELSLEVELDPERFGVFSPTRARILAIGVTPVFGGAQLIGSSAEVTADASRVQEMRAVRRQLSFDASITVPPQEYTVLEPADDSESRYSYTGCTEHFSGIGGWGMGDGPAASAVRLQSSPRLTNRPLSGRIRIALRRDIRANWGVFDSSGIPHVGTEPELTPVDLMLGVRIAICDLKLGI